MALRTNTITAVTGGNLFPKQYSDRLVIVPNGFGMNTNTENPVGSYARWETLVDNTSATSSECQPGLVTDQTAVVRYKLQNYGQYKARVKAFSACVLGTMFGRYESAGVGCGSVGILQSTNDLRRANSSPLAPNYLNNSPPFDMDDVKELSGLPSFVGDLEDIRLDYDIRTSGGGTQNKFIDMYLDDVSDQRRVIGGFPGPGYGGEGSFNGNLPFSTLHPEYINTINGINYNLTKDWNINVWLGVPDPPNDIPAGQDSDNNWAGGSLIGRYNIGGIDHDFYYKLETAGANNFDYIGLVMINPPDAGSVRILDYINFAKNTLPGIIANNPTANALYGNATTRGKPPPRMPDGNHVLTGVHVGTELFFSNPDGSEGVVEFHQLQFTVPSLGTFGWAKSNVPGTNVNPDYDTTVKVGETVVITPTQVGNNSLFVDTPIVDDTFVSIQGLNPSLIIRGDAATTGTVVGYLQADGTTGKINLSVTTDGGGGGGGTQSTNYKNNVNLGGTLEIDWAEVHTSGEEIINIANESDATKVKVEELNPKIKVRGLAIGTSIIEYKTTNGHTGTFTINTIAPDGGGGGGGGGGGTSPYIGTRWVNPGETINLNMNLMPDLFQDSDRVIAGQSGPGSAIVAGDDLEISVPVTGTGTGTVEIE